MKKNLHLISLVGFILVMIKIITYIALNNIPGIKLLDYILLIYFGFNFMKMNIKIVNFLVLMALIINVFVSIVNFNLGIQNHENLYYLLQLFLNILFYVVLLLQQLQNMEMNLGKLKKGFIYFIEIFYFGFSFINVFISDNVGLFWVFLINLLILGTLSLELYGKSLDYN